MFLIRGEKHEKRQNKTFQTFEKVTDNISYTAMSFSIFGLLFDIKWHDY